MGGFSLRAEGCILDTVNHSHYLRDIYTKAEPQYTGKVTVPVLWDKQTSTIVSNESRDIIRMFDTEFGDFAKPGVNFYPPELQDAIDETIDAIYSPINNGVYRSGFATTQAAYEEAVTELFQALNHWEEVLSQQRYLVETRLPRQIGVCLRHCCALMPSTMGTSNAICAGLSIIRTYGTT